MKNSQIISKSILSISLLLWVTPVWLNWHANKYFRFHSNTGVEEARFTLLITTVIAALLFVGSIYAAKKVKMNNYLYIAFASYILFGGWLTWLFVPVLL